MSWQITPRGRIIIFCICTSLGTLVFQWAGIIGFLNGVVGFSWSEPLVTFIRANTQGLVLLVILELFLEFIGLEKPRQRERKEQAVLSEILTRAIDSSSSRSLIQNCLSAEYGDKAADRLVNQILRPLPVLKEFSLSIRVRKGVNEGFNVLVSYQYEANINPFIVAITCHSLDAEALLSTGLFAEVFIVRRKQLEHEAVPVTIYCVRKGSSRPEALGKMSLSEYSTSQKKRLLNNTDVRNIADVRLFKGGFSFSSNGSQDIVQYKIRHEIHQDPDHSYTFWLSDRVLHVKNVEVDLSDLGVELYQSAHIHFFLAAVPWLANICGYEGVWDFPIDSWLVNGQGVLVVWNQAFSHSDKTYCNTNTFTKKKGGEMRCLQACYRMVFEALSGSDPGIAKADKETGYVPGRGTWQFRTILSFAKMGFTVLDHEVFNASKFIKEPRDALLKLVEDPEVVMQILNETDISAEARAIEGCLDHDRVNFLHTRPSLLDIKTALMRDRLLICNINQRRVNGEDGYLGHFVVVVGFNEQGLIVFDPDSSSEGSETIQFYEFQRAWCSPTENFANYIAIWKED